MMRTCHRCVQPFAVDPVIERRLRARGPGHYQKNCGPCVVLDTAELSGQSSEAVEKELRAAGVDVDGFKRIQA